MKSSWTSVILLALVSMLFVQTIGVGTHFAFATSPLSLSISPASVAIDVGQSQVFTASASGGAPPYSYYWGSGPSIVQALIMASRNGPTGSTTQTFTPTTTGSYFMIVIVNDSSDTQQSSSASITVNLPPSASISPTSTIMDVGQSQTYIAATSGGTSPFSYQWYLKGALVSNANSSTWTFAPTSSGSYTVYSKATDAAGVAAKSNNASVTVNPALLATISPNSTTQGVGQSQTFTVKASGGTPPYSYYWGAGPSLIQALVVAARSGPTLSANYTFTPPAPGSYYVLVVVLDSVSDQISVWATVLVPPTATISPTSAVLDSGQTKTFTCNVSGGSPPYTYQWYVNGVGAPGATGTTYTFAQSTPGYYSVYVNVTDSAGSRAKSNVASVTVNPVPSVSISPTSLVLDVGLSKLFTSSVSSGTPPYSYQWYLNGALVPGATGSTWTFIPVSSGPCTVYLKVTDSVGILATSNTATGTVNPSVSVTVSPNSTTLDVTQSKQFTSSPSGGSSSYTYRWFLNGIVVQNATNPTWTFEPNASGSYSVAVMVTDSLGEQAQSNSASVTVNLPPLVSISPTSVIMGVWQTQVFTASPSRGTTPYSYYWGVGPSLLQALINAGLNGSTSSSTYTFKPSAIGTYYVLVIVMDAVSAQSCSWTCAYVNSGISVSPASIVLDVGQSQTFASSVSGGTAPFTYQWFLNGTAVSGATGATWTFKPTSSSFYSVTVLVTDSQGKQQTGTASATVNPTPAVSILPNSLTLDVGQSRVFNSTVSGGTIPYTCQWYMNGTTITGATTATYNFAPTIQGLYKIYVNVTDSIGFKVKSNIATVTVNPAPIVSISPPSVTLGVGKPQVFTAAALNGTKPYSYYWGAGPSLIQALVVAARSGPTLSANYTFTPPAPGSYVVLVVVMDAVSAQSCSWATVTVNPTVNISPTSAVIDVGQSQTFTATVIGNTAPYTYQWYLNNAPVSGATDSSWTFTSSSSGSYTVYVNVTDNAGSVAKSNIATVTVNVLPPVSTSPSSFVMDLGQSAHFIANASGGTSPYSYQWYLNGSLVTGATSATWTFIPVVWGSYTVYVKIADSVGVTAKSNTATVTVNRAVSVAVSPTSVVMDVGQSQTFTSTPLGGSQFFTFQWYVNNVAVSGAIDPTYTFTPTSSGSYLVVVVVIDTLGEQASAGASVLVNPAISLSMSPASAVMDVGQSQVFAAQVSGGTTPYSYYWGVGTSLLQALIRAARGNSTTVASLTYTPTAPGSYVVLVVAMDAVSTQQCSWASITVNPVPSASISPTSVVLDVGQTQTLTASVSGGTSPYTCQWYMNGTTITGATTATYNFAPTSSGYYKLYFNVTDNVHVVAKSNTSPVTVNPALTLSISPTSVILGVGQSQVFNAAASGGTKPYAYYWGAGDSMIQALVRAARSGSTNATTYTFTPPSPGAYVVLVIVMDAVSVQQSALASMTLTLTPVVSITPSSANIYIGQSLTFSSSVAGGTPSYTYQWYLNGAAVFGANSSTWTFTPSATGTYSVYVVVTDSANVKVQSNTASVNVLARGRGGGPIPQ